MSEVSERLYIGAGEGPWITAHVLDAGGGAGVCIFPKLDVCWGCVCSSLKHLKLDRGQVGCPGSSRGIGQAETCAGI